MVVIYRRFDDSRGSGGKERLTVEVIGEWEQNGVVALQCPYVALVLPLSKRQSSSDTNQYKSTQVALPWHVQSPAVRHCTRFPQFFVC